MKWERIFCFVCKIFFCKQVSFICLSLVYCTIMCIILHSKFRKYLGDIKWNGKKLLTRVTNLKCFWMLSSAFNQNPLRSKQIYCLIIHIIYERERGRESKSFLYLLVHYALSLSWAFEWHSKWSEWQSSAACTSAVIRIEFLQDQAMRSASIMRIITWFLLKAFKYCIPWHGWKRRTLGEGREAERGRLAGDTHLGVSLKRK